MFRVLGPTTPSDRFIRTQLLGCAASDSARERIGGLTLGTVGA